MTDDLRYPTGRFTPPAAFDATVATQHRREIAEHPARLRAAVDGLDDARLDTRYRDGGWTVRQLVHHVVDSHFNAYSRIKLALTENNPTIKPYDEALWAELVDSRTLPVAPSLAMLDALHLRWSTLLDSLSPAEMQRTFVHPEHELPMPVYRAMAMYAWHGKHHTAHVTSLRARCGW